MIGKFLQWIVTPALVAGFAMWNEWRRSNQHDNIWEEQIANRKRLRDLEIHLTQQIALTQRQTEETYRQLDALLSLHSQLDLAAPLPPMRQWAISPDFANLIVNQIKQHQPKVILELGGGISTLISSYCLQQIGDGKVIAIDHMQEFATQTRDQITLHQLSQWADVRHAPLAKVDLDGASYEWYAPQTFDDLHNIDLLIVDGPSQHDNPVNQVRYPALPLLKDKLSPNAIILVDDANRAHEAKMLQQWMAGYEFAHTQAIDTERGAMILKLTADS